VVIQWVSILARVIARIIQHTNKTFNIYFYVILLYKMSIRNLFEPNNFNLQAEDITVEDVFATDVNATDVNATDVNATDVNATDVNATDVNSTNLFATDLTITNINGAPYVGGGGGGGISGIINYFPKFNISSDWVAYGDSYTDYAFGWRPALSTMTGTTNINKSVSGSTSDYATSADAITKDTITNVAYASKSSIIMYGFNDVRNSKTLFGNYYAWAQSFMSLVLGACLPQNKINTMREVDWTKSGVWSDPIIYTGFSTVTSANGAFVEKDLGTVRYIAVRHSLTTGVACDWVLTVNGTHANEFNWVNTAIEGNGIATRRTIAYIIDLGVDTPNAVVKIKNNAAGGGGNDNYIDFVCGYVAADLVNARDVLLLSIPRFNFEYTGVAPFDAPSETKRVLMNEAIKSVALSCRSVGLPVSYYEIADMMSVFNPDMIHPTIAMGKHWAEQIFNNAIA